MREGDLTELLWYFISSYLILLRSVAKNFPRSVLKNFAKQCNLFLLKGRHLPDNIANSRYVRPPKIVHIS